MPAKKKNNAKTKQKQRRPLAARIVRWAALCAALAVLALAVCMAVEASVVRVEYADVYLSDLPEAFDGTRVLFIADIHVDHFNPPERAAALVTRLQALGPDLLLLGGDYSSTDLGSFVLSGLRVSSPQRLRVEEQRARDRFFELLRGFVAPLGKYGVPGNHDVELDDLAGAMALGEIELLRNEARAIEKDGERLLLVGLDDWTTGAQDPAGLARQADARDCVLVLSHNPDALPALNSQPSRDGGPWVDLMLAGHLHGGQVTLFGGRPIFRNSIYDRYLSGWYEENGAHMLISNGVGSVLLPLRLGAPPQAHLITLYRRR